MRILETLAGLRPHARTHAVARAAADEAKASATGPLIVLETLGRPVWTPRDYEAFAREGFMQNAIVYRAVRMIAEAAASVPLMLFEDGGEHEEHPLLDLLARPSLDQTGTDFLEAWYGYLLVAGNAYVEAVALDGRVRELHALRPDRMKVVPGAEGWPEAYEYTCAGRTVRFEEEPVAGVRPILHLRLFHPANDHYGMSPVEAAAQAIDIHNTAGRWNKALLDNSARPSGALVYGGADGRMTPEQFERLKAELEDGFQGPRRAGRPLLLEGGLDWKPLSLSPKDMDFIAARNGAAREIALAFGVPPMLLGIPGDNTYTDDPHDPGGPTNRGITLAVFAAWRKLALTDANRVSLIRDLKAIDHPTVREIYRRRYWNAAHCGGLPAPLALMHFDAAVNHGVGNAVRFLQEAVGASVDGEIGPETQAAVARTPASAALDAYAAIRKRRYRALPHFWRFGRGWLRRVDITLARARALAPETVSTSPQPEGYTDMTTTTGPLDGKWWGHSITIWGTIVTLLSTMLPVLAPVTGIDVDSGLVQDAGTQVVEVMQAVGALIGTLMTIYGRVRATEPIQKALLKKD